MQIIFFPSHDLSSFFFWRPIVFDNLFCSLILLWFYSYFLLSISMVIIRLNWRGSTQNKIYFQKNVELTSAFFTLQRFGPSLSPNFKIIIFILYVGVYVRVYVCVVNTDFYYFKPDLGARGNFSSFPGQTLQIVIHLLEIFIYSFILP